MVNVVNVSGGNHRCLNRPLEVAAGATFIEAAREAVGDLGEVLAIKDERYQTISRANWGRQVRCQASTQVLEGPTWQLLHALVLQRDAPGPSHKFGPLQVTGERIRVEVDEQGESWPINSAAPDPDSILQSVGPAAKRGDLAPQRTQLCRWNTVGTKQDLSLIQRPASSWRRWRSCRWWTSSVICTTTRSGR
jgi:hypothetical protein